MEKRVLTVCSVAGFLAILSAATAFAAEATRIKASQVQFVSPIQCAYPRTPAFPLGLTSVMALLISQILLSVSNGCCCCSRNTSIPDCKWTFSVATCVLSCLNRFTFVIAFLLLLTGAALNDQHGEESMYFGNYYCYIVKPGVFAGGAILSLATVGFGIVHYLIMTTRKNPSSPGGDSAYPNQGAIAMAQPQIPSQTSQDPVFVHEDTYMRRQIA